MLGQSRAAGACLAVVWLPWRAVSVERPSSTKTRVADGIFLFQTGAYGDVGLDGNSVVIVSDEGVVVFDSNGAPAAAAPVLAEIRRMTDQPARHHHNSHST
jgi:hypothetical protein